MSLAELESEIANIIKNCVTIEDVPYSMIDGARQISSESITSASEYIADMLIYKKVITLEQPE